ncbi:Cyclic AMP-dependent protein kinase [Phytophthora megakarya]|uniref:Cyclic AMP-dependent protein kinase n=1 Tax=Phytophthora megakarya TaxID=4795 RepID=A0A225USS8_9STRA|nr:Cyclic AMP-dependent protein kinase [Phytophthora megakarya]
MIPTLQLDDTTIMTAQRRRKLVKKLLKDKTYNNMNIKVRHGLIVVATPHGYRVVLPPELWAIIFKECHDSVWAGDLRAPHTQARISKIYCVKYDVGWPVAKNAGVGKSSHAKLYYHCGASEETMSVIDKQGRRYVVAALEYVTRYAVAEAVLDHTADSVAEFLMKRVVLRFGPFRELLTDEALELIRRAIERLVGLLQARQTTPRSGTIGSGKIVIDLYADRGTERLEYFATYAYNSGRHSTVGLSPNEPMMGRRLRSPGELLRSLSVQGAGELTTYHKRLVSTLKQNNLIA